MSLGVLGFTDQCSGVILRIGSKESDLLFVLSLQQQAKFKQGVQGLVPSGPKLQTHAWLAQQVDMTSMQHQNHPLQTYCKATLAHSPHGLLDKLQGRLQRLPPKRWFKP